MRYILTFLIVVCMSAFYAYKTADADSGKFPHNKGGFNVKGAFTWGEYGIFSGDVFFVSSTHANASNDPSSGFKRNPFSTLDYAISRTGVTSGDLFICLPGHIETVTAAAGLDLDVAGISIIGIGSGSSRPTIRFTTAAGADMDVGAANITMANILFEARVVDTTAGIDVNAADFKLLNCETRDVDAAGEFLIAIQTDANADRMLIDGYIHRGTSTPLGGDSASPLAAIGLTGGDDIVIRNFDIYGAFDISAIMATVTACTRLSIYGSNGLYSHIWTEDATDSAIAIMKSTGRVGPHISIRLQDNAVNLASSVTGSNTCYIMPIEVVNADNETSVNWGATTNHPSSTGGL